ncbi:unnamed protein product, partial [Dovyalis caffra]
AWRLWNEERELEFVDPLLMERSPTAGIVRCIHIGLLCVQEDPADRPTMSFVVSALGSDPIALPQPKQPAFSLRKMVPVDKSSSKDPSANQMTVSGISPRKKEKANTGLGKKWERSEWLHLAFVESAHKPLSYWTLSLKMHTKLLAFGHSRAKCTYEHIDIGGVNNTSNYTINSPFENNLKLLLQLLPSNTSLTGFNYTSVGESPAKVYGQALCRGDVNSSACQACVEKAIQEIFNVCRSFREAIIWSELCQVHDSFQNMTSLFVYTGKYPDGDSREKFVSNPVQFYDEVTDLMTKLSNEAVFNPSNLMFATGEIKLSRSETIYGHVQCTRGIGADDCQKCLESAIIDLKGCYSSRKGGIVLSRTCNVRFELYQFYEASSYFLTYPSSRGRKWKMWKVASVVFISVMGLATVVGSSIEDPADRPTMSFVVSALGSDPRALPRPKKPAFSLRKMVPMDRSSSIDPSVNEMTVSGISPR